jgi:hypothetical protein
MALGIISWVIGVAGGFNGAYAAETWAGNPGWGLTIDQFQRSVIDAGGVRRCLNPCPWSVEDLTGKRLDTSRPAIIHLSIGLPVISLMPARGAIRKELHHEAAQLVEGIPPPGSTGPPGCGP